MMEDPTKSERLEMIIDSRMQRAHRSQSDLKLEDIEDQESLERLIALNMRVGFAYGAIAALQDPVGLRAEIEALGYQIT